MGRHIFQSHGVYGHGKQDMDPEVWQWIPRAGSSKRAQRAGLVLQDATLEIHAKSLGALGKSHEIHL